MKINQWANNYLPYIIKFGGVKNGLKVAKTLFPKKHNNEIVSVTIPKVETPVFVRLGTTDVSNFHENLMLIEFPMPDYLDPKLIIDAGANAGYASLYLLNKFKKAEVIAIEPDESNFKMLSMNCNSYKNFKGIQSAIWINEGFVKIKNPEVGHTAFRVVETTKEDKKGFSAVTIEKVLNESGFDRIGILKIDIEGTEKELFEENYKNWLDKVDVLIIELHDRFKPGCALAFYSVIEKYNFVQHANGGNLVYINKDIIK